MGDNVIKFPKEKYNSPENIQTQEDVLLQINEYKTSFANDLSEILSNYIFGELARSGVDFDGDIDSLFPIMLLVTESIQALQLKASGVSHPLQELAIDIYGDGENSFDSSEKIDYNTLLDDED
jgi:hypothetical protein